MKTQLFVLVQLVLAAMLMWTCFCRLVKTDADTHREVRWAIWFEGVAAGLVLGAPVLPLMMPADIHWEAGTTPSWVWLVLLTAATMIQIVTARYWREGKVPAPFQGRAGTFAVLLALVMLGSPTPAKAQAPDLVLKNRDTGGQLRLMDSPCTHAETLAHLREEWRPKFKNARILDRKGFIQFYGCWIEHDEDVVWVLLQDGAEMAFPIAAFSDPNV